MHLLCCVHNCTYTRIRPDDEVLDTRQHFVIGDVHGDIEKLTNLLKRVGIENRGNYWINRKNLHVVFLGDLNDPRMNTEEESLEMSSFRCIQTAKELCDSGVATAIRSNHQRNLIRLWSGQRKDLGYGLAHTNTEMNWLVSTRGRDYVGGLINWLDSLPFFYSFREKGQLFTAVHAYYTAGMGQYCPKEKEGDAAIYGLKRDGERFEWWNETAIRDRTVIAGHYHQVIFPACNQVVLLDGECGNTGGRLLGWLVTENRLLEQI